MKKVAMFVTNPCTHDARVIKEAMSLNSAGYELRVFALSNDVSPEGVFQENGYTVQRIKFDSIFLRCIHFFYKGCINLIKLITFPFVLFWNLVFVPIFNVKMLENITQGELPKGSLSSTLKERNTNQNSARELNKKTSFFSKYQNIVYRVTYKVINECEKVVVKLLMPLHKTSTYYYFCTESAKLANEWGVEIVHCHDLNTMYVGKLLKDQDASRKVVYDSHELWIHRNRVGRKAILERWFDKFCEKRLITYADEIITVCDSIADWLKERYPSTPKITILRNMPYKLVERNDNSTGLKERLNIPQDQIVIMYTGKITTGRGISIGLKAVESNPNVTFVLLGYGEESYVEGVHKLIKSKGIEERVIFCDPVPHNEVSAFIYGADLALVFIEPICLSYEYALPNKLFESIQAGVPILGSELVEIEKIVKGCDIGLCFKDENDLVSKLNNIDSNTSIKWRENISKHQSELCWDEEQQQLIDLYERISI